MMKGNIAASHPKVKQFIAHPVIYKNVAALSFHHLDADDLKDFCAELWKVLQALKTADTLYLPYGPIFKCYRKLPYLRISCTDHVAEMTQILTAARSAGCTGVEEPNTDMMPSPHLNEVAFDITEKVLTDDKTSFLAKLPLLQAFANRDDSLVAMYQLFGSIMESDAKWPKGAFFMPQEYEQCPTYEVQIRGIRNAAPKIVLRTVREFCL